MYSAYTPCCHRELTIPWYDGLPKLINSLTLKDETEEVISLCEKEIMSNYSFEKIVQYQLFREMYMQVAYKWRNPNQYVVEIEDLSLFETSNPVLM